MENNYEKIADELLKKVRHGDKKSFHELEELAANGNARALSNLAQIYLKGFGIVESSYKKAVSLFKKAAALNEVYALFRLGEFYRDAKCGFEQDGHKAAEYFIKAAQHATANGSAKCLRLAAEIYHYGKGGVTPDGLKAIELYKKLDEQGDKRALMGIAQIYTNGCGNLKPDSQKAVEYLNSLEAHFELAEFYRRGKAGVNPNGHKVIEHLSQLGFRHMKSIVEIYCYGKYNVKSDGCKAVEYLLKKSESDFHTLDKIAEFYLKRDSNFDHDDHNDAVEYCSETMDFCNVDAFQEVAKIYLEGKGGVQVDGYKALEYFSKAAEGVDTVINFTKKFVENNGNIKQKRQGLVRRVFRWLERISKNLYKQIAEIYRDGKAGVQPDGYKAVEYFLRAVASDKNSGKDISDIYNEIAQIYLEGRGNVQTDGHKAVEYFEKSSNFKRIAEIYRDGKAGVQSDGYKAVEYFLKHEAAIRSRSDEKMSDSDTFFNNTSRAEAFRNVAEIYFKLGDGQKALEYFLKADELGDEWAYINVARIYREGRGNLKPDGVKLIAFLTKKLEQDEFYAENIICDIAAAYEEGCGSLEPNMQKAMEFYQKAAEVR